MGGWGGEGWERDITSLGICSNDILHNAGLFFHTVCREGGGGWIAQ